MSSRLPLIDFHCHFVPRPRALTTHLHGSAHNRERWSVINEFLQDESALLEDIDSGDIQARVINTPSAFLEDAQGKVDAGIYAELNQALAALVSRHPDRLYGLASVDPWSGDRAAKELVHAVNGLGLHGVFLPCAQGSQLLDHASARPVLEAAAELDVPVFIHPINPDYLTPLLDPYGRNGTLLARGTINSIAWLRSSNQVCWTNSPIFASSCHLWHSQASFCRTRLPVRPSRAVRPAHSASPGLCRHNGLQSNCPARPGRHIGNVTLDRRQ